MPFFAWRTMRPGAGGAREPWINTGRQGRIYPSRVGGDDSFRVGDKPGITAVLFRRVVCPSSPVEVPLDPCDTDSRQLVLDKSFRSRPCL